MSQSKIDDRVHETVTKSGVQEGGKLLVDGKSVFYSEITKFVLMSLVFKHGPTVRSLPFLYLSSLNTLYVLSKVL